MASVLNLENSQVRETFMGTSGMQKIKRQGETHYPSQQAACLATGNWGELGGDRRADSNPRSTWTTGSSLEPFPGAGGGEVRRADWLKDQPHPRVCKAIPPSAPLACPRARAPAARVSSGLWTPSSPGLQLQPSRPRTGPGASRSPSLAGPSLAWEAPRSGAPVCPVFSEGLVSGDSLGADGI